MNLMVDPDRLWAAYETARCDLLAESTADGHWTGSPSSSALSTATAISALATVERRAPTVAGRIVDEQRECALSELIMGSLRWLAKCQNADGGWGDTEAGPSNLIATLAVRAAFALTCVPAKHPGLLERADAYIVAQGGVRGLKRRFAKERTLIAPVLANCALAGLVDWSQVPAMPFELVCLPSRYWRHAHLPVDSFGIPLLVAVGHARYVHRRPANPLAATVRGATVERSLEILGAMQSTTGGYLEAVPWTSFVVMSLTSIGRAEHPIVRRGVEFLLSLVRPDGSWPIDANLATLNTARAVAALAAAGEDTRDAAPLDWLVQLAHRAAHPITGAAAGGWSATDLPGGVPDAVTTSCVLGALAAMARSDSRAREKALAAARTGLRWLVDLQNPDGGWPTFARGWSTSPRDESAADVTAQALRALGAWRRGLAADENLSQLSRQALDASLGRAIDLALRYLAAAQQRDGCWRSLWFGDPTRGEEGNAVIGTSGVLLALGDLDRLDSPPPRRALDWLLGAQHRDGSFGGTANRAPTDGTGTIEETALAVEALSICGQAQAHEDAAARGIRFLIDAVEANRHADSAPLGQRFSRLWYAERLWPLCATVSALGHAARRLLPHTLVRSAAPSLKR